MNEHFPNSREWEYWIRNYAAYYSPIDDQWSKINSFTWGQNQGWWQWIWFVVRKRVAIGAYWLSKELELWIYLAPKEPKRILHENKYFLKKCDCIFLVFFFCFYFNEKIRLDLLFFPSRNILVSSCIAEDYSHIKVFKSKWLW